MLTKAGGLWQYGTLQWDEFYGYLVTFIVTTTNWSIFCYDPTKKQHGAPYPPAAQVVQPGHYIVLSDGESTL